MFFLYFLSVILFCCLSSVSFQNLRLSLDDPSVFYNMIELVCSEGYYIQEHTVVTDDGYILNIYRIPNGKKRQKVLKKRSQYQKMHKGYHPDFANCVEESLNESSSGPAVLLSHGFSAASDCWVLQGAGYDLAFLLADKNYDVWFANIRGNFYSRQHKILNPSEIAFWDFRGTWVALGNAGNVWAVPGLNNSPGFIYNSYPINFHENGIYDITSIIDYILQLRGLKKLYYIGHSMGSTMFFVMASSKPEYNDKIQLFMGLTPVGQIRRENFSPSRLTVLKSVLRFVKAFVSIGVHEILPRSFYPNFFAKIICVKGSPFQDLCYDLGYFFTGYHSKLFLRNKLHIYLSHGLSGISAKTFFHYDQLLDAPYFQPYDYGPAENLKKYGQSEPPEYDLKKVTVPIALYYSKGDYIADVRDIAYLKKFLPNIVEDRVYSKFNHIDFLLAYNAKDLFYARIIELMDKYKNQ